MHLAPNAHYFLLVVDDDEVDRRATLRALRDAALDVRIIECDGAAEAERLATAHAFDCVLLDFRLPGTDGLAVLRKLRARGVTAPVIVTTGFGDEALAVELMKAGAADYLPKATLSPDRIARSIVSAVRLANAERETESTRKKLESAERRYRFLAEAIPQMVWVVRDDGAVEFVNRRWTAYTGLDAETMRGALWESVIHPDEREAMRAKWENAVERREPIEAQVRMRRQSDGAYRWHLLRGEPMPADDGGIWWFGTTTDIEQQKSAEAELTRLATQAERMRASAEEANHAKDQFLATLSHELRTPINAILGWATMLRRPGIDEAARTRAIDIIDRNARTQTQLIEDLLDVSRIVTGKLHIDRQPVDLCGVVQAAVDSVRPSADAKKVVLAADLPNEALVVLGDAARLQQVVWNILSNAVKFTPAGSAVALSARRDGASVVIVVSDQGEGIDGEFLPHVFERLRQGHAGARAGGLGLGLAIVRTLVEMHGGAVRASSEGRGHGATFTITLPFDSAASLPAGVVSEPPANVESLAGVRVLVIEDHADGREMLEMSLASFGMTVCSAGSAPEARAILEKTLPHLIVSDIGLPGEDGYAFVADLRKRPPELGGRVPAIALTGFAGIHDHSRAREAGFDAHVPKPVDFDRLVRTIRRLLGASRAVYGTEGSQGALR